MNRSLRVRFYLLLLAYGALVAGALWAAASGPGWVPILLLAPAGLLVWWGVGLIRGVERAAQRRTEQRIREWAASVALSEELAAPREVQPTLEAVAKRARETLRGAAAAVCLVDDRQQALYLAAGDGVGAAAPGLRQPMTAYLPDQVIHAGRTVVSETACSGCRFLQAIPDGQFVAAPLRLRDATLGALCVVRSAAQGFDAQEQSAFAVLGNAAAVAVMQARRMEHDRQETAARTSRAERARLAAELHDNLAQTLSFLNLKAGQLEAGLAQHGLAGAQGLRATERELAQMRGAVNKAYGQVRSALADLQGRPEAEDAPPSLAPQLAACVEELRAATAQTLELDIRAAEACRLPAMAQRQAIHIVREAVLNAARHAHARCIRITVDTVEDATTDPNGRATRITVADDGRGFAPDAVDGTRHLGLGIMRARAERSGGKLTVESRPGQGTRVIAVFPQTECPRTDDALPARDGPP